MNNYKDKYLQYKDKYLSLKSQNGGTIILDQANNKRYGVKISQFQNISQFREYVKNNLVPIGYILKNILYAGTDLLKKDNFDLSRLENGQIYIIFNKILSPEQLIKELDIVDIKLISRKKPVATLASGSPIEMFIINWSRYNPQEKIFFMEILNKITHVKVSIFDKYLSNHEIRSQPVFYNNESLEILHFITNKSIDELLNIFSLMGDKTDDELSLIQIAFNDKIKNLSPNGLEWFKNYKEVMGYS